MKLGSLLAVGGIQSFQPSLHAGFWVEMMLCLSLCLLVLIYVCTDSREMHPQNIGEIFSHPRLNQAECSGRGG